MPNRYAILLEDESKPVQPSADMHAVRKTAKPLAGKPASPQADMSARPQVRLSANPQAGFSAKDTRERYSTRLLPETVKAIRLYAIEHDINDYEVVEQGFKLLQEKEKAGSPQTRK